MPVSVACTIGRHDSAARSAASEACWAGAQLCWKDEVEDWATSNWTPSAARWRLMSGNAVSKQTSGPSRSVPVSITTCWVPGLRSWPAALPTDVAQPSTERSGMYSPKGTSRILSYVGPVTPSGPISSEVLEMPAPSARGASTLTSRSAPTSRDRAASRVRGRRVVGEVHADAALAPHHQVGVGADQPAGQLRPRGRSARRAYRRHRAAPRRSGPTRTPGPAAPTATPRP